jgi:hypothetical protein
MAWFRTIFPFLPPPRLAPSPLVAAQYRLPPLSELQVIEAHYGPRQVFFDDFELHGLL